MDLNEIKEYLVNNDIATEEEITLVTQINGWNEESLNDIIYARTGYHDMEQYTESEDRETYNEYFKEEEE